MYISIVLLIISIILTCLAIGISDNQPKTANFIFGLAGGLNSIALVLACLLWS